MNVTIYTRVSTSQQTIENQRHEIYKYCTTKDLVVTNEINVVMSTRKSCDERKTNELLELPFGSHLIVSELSRLGRSTVQVISLVDELIQAGIIVHLIKQNMVLHKKDIMGKLMITILSAFCELERDLISQRTREALSAKKAAGVILGRKSTGVFEKLHIKIHKLLAQGMGKAAISRKLNISRTGLTSYLKRCKK